MVSIIISLAVVRDIALAATSHKRGSLKWSIAAANRIVIAIVLAIAKFPHMILFSKQDYRVHRFRKLSLSIEQPAKQQQNLTMPNQRYLVHSILCSKKLRQNDHSMPIFLCSLQRYISEGSGLCG